MSFVHAKVGRLAEVYIVLNAGKNDIFFCLVVYGIEGFLVETAALGSHSGASIPLYDCILWAFRIGLLKSWDAL